MYEGATFPITLLLPQTLHKYEFGIFITKHSFKIRKKAVKVIRVNEKIKMWFLFFTKKKNY